MVSRKRSCAAAATAGHGQLRQLDLSGTSTDPLEAQRHPPTCQPAAAQQERHTGRSTHPASKRTLVPLRNRPLCCLLHHRPHLQGQARAGKRQHGGMWVFCDRRATTSTWVSHPAGTGWAVRRPQAGYLACQGVGSHPHPDGRTSCARWHHMLCPLCQPARPLAPHAMPPLPPSQSTLSARTSSITSCGGWLSKLSCRMLSL